MDKSESQKIHATKRANQRHGLHLSNSDYQQIVKMIQEQKGEFLFSQSNRISHWKISWNNSDCHVVYDKIRSTVVTFLPYRQSAIDALRKEHEMLRAERDHHGRNKTRSNPDWNKPLNPNWSK